MGVDRPGLGGEPLLYRPFFSPSSCLRVIILMSDSTRAIVPCLVSSCWWEIDSILLINFRTSWSALIRGHSCKACSLSSISLEQCCITM